MKPSWGPTGDTFVWPRRQALTFKGHAYWKPLWSGIVGFDVFKSGGLSRNSDLPTEIRRQPNSSARPQAGSMAIARGPKPVYCWRRQIEWALRDSDVAANRGFVKNSKLQTKSTGGATIACVPKPAAQQYRTSPN